MIKVHPIIKLWTNRIKKLWIYENHIYVNCGVKNYLKEDHRSCIRNLCSYEKKA